VGHNLLVPADWLVSTESDFSVILFYFNNILVK